MTDKLRRIPPWGWALLFAVVLCLPRLGSFGFWDPWELKIADQARDMARTSVFDVTAGGKYPRSAGSSAVLAAIGIKMFGARELAARLPIALCAVAALMAVYWAGASLFRRRAGLLATLALGSMTMFALEARQLTSDAPLIAALAIALGGLGRYAWPPAGQRRWRDLGIGAGGLLAGYLAGGALLGVALPSLALTGALLVGWGLRVRTEPTTDGTETLADAGAGPDLPAGSSLGQRTLRPGTPAFFVFAALAALGAAALIATLTGLTAGKYSGWLGATPRAGAPTMGFEYLVRQLGFGLFPWSAVAIFALARPLIRLDDQDGVVTNSRLAFGQSYLLAFTGLGFALSTYVAFIAGPNRFVALPAIALAIGAFLDEAMEGNRAEPVAGLLIATGTMVIARDFFLDPHELVSVHLLDKAKWPGSLSIGYSMLAVGLVLGAGIYTGLATRGRALGKVALRELGDAAAWRRRLEKLVVEAGRWGLQVAVACAVVFALGLTYGLVPALSTHFSFKPVLDAYSKFARQGERIGKYRVESRGSGFYGRAEMVDLPSLDRLNGFLRDGQRVFALVAADELAAIDANLKAARVPYYVVDGSSSRFLLLSNQLGAGERDDNPLKKYVWMSPNPPAPGTGAWQPGEQPPWKYRVPVSATFGDSIELIGADFPQSVRRPGKVPIDLIFRVKARPPAGYKIFVHLDGPAAPRVIGDHDPVGKTFPTSYWLVGEYIRDHHEVEVPLMTTPAGTYHVFMGWWPGGEGKRLKITQGPNDGADRVKIGTVEIK